MSAAPAKTEARAEPTPADPWDAPAAYLRSKGWEPLGPPNRDGTAWYDPLAPEKAKEERKVVCKRVLESGAVADVFQTHVTPARYPMTLKEAMETQMARDKGKAARGK